MNVVLLIFFVIIIFCIIILSFISHNKTQKTKRKDVLEYELHDKLTISKRKNESTEYHKAILIERDLENLEYFYCQVIYCDLYEEPIERIHLNNIVKNLSLEHRRKVN